MQLRPVSEFTIAELSGQLNITEAALRHAVSRGQLPVVRRWGRLFVTLEGIEMFLRHRTRRDVPSAPHSLESRNWASQARATA